MLYLNNPNSRLSLPNLEEDDYETGILEEFGKGVSSGVDQLQGLIGGGGRALIGSALGDDDLFYDGMRYFDEQMAEAAENAADVGSLEEIDGIGDFAKYSAFVVGNVIPSLIGGGGAGAVGGYAAKRLAMHQAGKALVKQSAGQLSKKQAATQYARSTVGQEALAKRGLRGQMVGATLFGTAAGAGESFTRIFDETGEEAAVEAIITGVASGALDAMAPMRALKRILPQKTFRDATEEVAGNIAKNRSVYRRALSEAGKTGATEGVTEMMQEIVQNATLEVVRGYDAELEDSFLERMFDDAKLSQYANAFVAGTIGGAAMGGATGALTRDPESRESIVRQEQLPSPEDVDRSQAEAESAEQVEEQAPTEQPQETFEERRKAVRQKAQGLPQRRREIPTANPEETRGGLQQDIIDKSLPQRRSSTPEQATVSRESIQARIQAQVDAMPAARDNAKRILKEVTQGQGRQGTYRNDGAGERVVITPPSPPVSTTEVSGALPDPAATTPPMKDLVGQDVEYNGNKGLLIEKDDGYYVATQDNGDVLIESGLNKSPAELGVVPVSGDLEFENDFEIDRKTKKFNLRGEEFTLTRIVRDADGNALSLAVRDGKGKRKTIRTKSVVQRADAQMTPPPDFSQIQVEMDDLPPAVQKMVINQSDPENIPDEVPAQEAIDIAQTIDEDTAEKVTQIASNRITIGATAEKYDSAQKFTGTIRDSKVTKLSEAIAEVNASQDAGRTAIDEARIRSLLDVEDHVMQDGTTVSGAGIAESGRYADQVGVALVDLFEAGMPKAFLRSVTGIRVHSGIENPDLGSSDGGYSTKSGFVTISKDLLNDAEKASETGSGTDANLRFVMAHELGHAYDVATAHSDNSPEFMLEMDGISPDNVTLDMGEVMHELASNYQSGTELGREMAYPFGYSFDWIMNSESGKAEQMLEVIRREAFAQSFAVFHSSPELLEQQAPLTYNYMKNILQTAPVEGRSNAENNTDTQEDVTSAEGVRGDVQPSSQPRDPEVQDGTGDRGDGGSSVDARQASEGVGDQTQQEDGDNTGQPVQLERTPVVLKATDKKPTFKKALNWEDTGNYIVTFADGDRYTLHFDDYSKEAGDEVYFTSEDGKVTAIGGMLGETKEETITELQQHRQKLIDAGENSYNLPLDPDVGSETREKALDIILDHPEGKIKLTDLRKKFRKLEDNQFDQMIKDLTDVPDATPEDIYVVEDGVISHPLTVQEIEEERLAEERMIAEEAEFEDDLQGLMDNDIPIDDFLFAPFTRVPEPDENAPVLPMGKVEQSLADLLAKNPNPTAEQLGEIVGAPKKRKGKESVEDVDVRPVTLDELRRYIRESLSESDNLKWYDEFGRFFRDLVGDANLDEASVIFGVTSAQNSAENNLSETLHIMALARKFDPVKQRKQFELAVKETPRSGGRKLMVTGAQIKAIADLYAEGNFAGGIKTTTYMQMVQDRGRNEYNPFSVQDVHMSRVFGFRRKDYKKNKDGSKGALLDASKISSENEYRYAQYLTSVLADEFGMSPNQMQATLWFYAKQNLSPLVDSGRKGGDGTLASAVKYSEREIDVIRDMIDSGTFDTNSSVSEALSEGVRPSNKPTQKNTPFSNVNEREQLMGVARARSPKLIASAVAGKGRGLAFPDDTPIETLIQYNQDVMAAIVDDGGQIPILRELGIPHEIAESAGSYTGYEPSIIIRLLGGTMQTADKLAPLIGDALLQDAVITSQAVYGKEGLPSFMIRKTDRSEFTREEAMALAERVNPDKNPDGLNFNQPMADTLTFLDPRSLSDDTYTDSQAKEFAGILINTLGDEYTMSVATTEGNYHGSDQYREAIERAWNPDGAEGRPDIYDRTNDSLYEPVRKVYNEYAEKLGIPKREAQDLDFLNSPPSALNPNATLRYESQNLLERGDLRGAMKSLSLYSENKAVRNIASKLAEVTNNRQNLQTAREATKRSKVKSIVYHGSSQTNITEFKAGDVSQGLYFSPDRNLSELYMSGLIGAGSSPSSSGKGRVYEVMLDIRNPLVLKGEDQLTFIEKIPVALGRKTKKEVVRAKNAKQLDGTGVFNSTILSKSDIATLKAQGYDGIMNEDLNEYVVFDSSQIHMVDSGKGGTQVQVVDGLKTAGSFNAKTNTIQLDSSRGMNEHTLLHEMAHAATSATLNDQNHPLTRQLTKLFEDVKPFLGDAYGTKSIDEFVAEAMSNQEFRASLDAIPYKGTQGSALQRFLSSVGDFIRRLAGIDSEASARKEVERLVEGILAPAPASRGSNNDDLLFSPPSKAVGKPNTNVIPEVNAAYQKFKAGEISQQDFDTVVLSTISEYDFVPTPATYDEMFGALNKNKKQKINIDIQDGEVVGLRLDIPAYTDHGVWVPTIHGDKTSHRATASITGVKFGDDKQPAKAQKVMEGGHKSPFAQMRGAFVNRTDAENEALAREALNDPDWTQIGFDPRRHSYFYDRKTGQPIVSAEEVIQVGPLVLAKNASSEGKTSSDFLFSPPSPTYDEVNAARNAQIREEKKKVDKASGWLKTTFKRQLTSRGLLNEQVFQAKVARDGEFGAAEIDTRMYLNSYDRAVKEANLSEYQTGLLSQAIGTPLDKLNNLDLPDAVKQAIGNMRKYLDKMSIDYAQVVADQAQELAKSGRGEAAVAKVDLLNTIVANKGKYLNRSFQVFDDPKWANKVPKPVIDNARTFLESNGAQNADRIINTILKTGTAFDGLTSFISEGKLGSKDLSILKKRKDIAPEILALMGEYTDPRINFVKTSTKLSRLLFNHRFLEEVKLKGEQDGFLFTADNAPTEAYVQIAPDSSDAMNPLNGLYTTPELAQGFKDVMDLGSEEGFWRAYRQLNSMVKYGKTVIAPTTMARNFMSASLFTVANGHFNWSKAGQSLRSLDGYFNSKEGDATAYLREIKRLGVVYDSPYAGELTKALEDFSNASELDSRVAVADGVGEKVKKGLASGTNFFAKFYQYGDDFWKIIGFENMVDVLMENKGLTREQAMPLAAERIRDTYPTYSLIGKGVQELRKFPLVGTFVSFPAEIIRTSFNMFRYLKQDMADPDMRSHAMAKIAGMSAVSFGIYALQDAALRAFDVDEEEEEAIRLMSPNWSENSNILPTGRDEDGNLEYIDLTYLDPYAYFKKPINALLRDQPTDDAVVQAGKELLAPFFGIDILTGSVLEIYGNEKLSGGRIYNPSDTALNISSDIAGHFVKSAGPAVLQNINRMEKAVKGDVSKSGKRYEVDDEMMALFGFRVTTFDPKISLHFKAYEFNEDKRNATSLLTSTFRDPNQLDEGELVNAFERASAARKEGYERMIKLVSAARKSGLNNTQLMMVLRSNGVTKKDARAMIAGNPAAWEMSDSTLKNSVKKSDLLFGEKTTKAYQDRWKVIQQLLLEETP